MLGSSRAIGRFGASPSIGFAAYGLSIRPLPHLAAGLSCQRDAHEHHQVGGLRGRYHGLSRPFPDLVVGGSLIDHLLARDTTTKDAQGGAGRRHDSRVVLRRLWRDDDDKPGLGDIWITPLRLADLRRRRRSAGRFHRRHRARGRHRNDRRVMNFFNNLMGAIALAVTGF